MSRAGVGALLFVALVIGAPPAILGEPGVLRVGLPSVPAIVDPAGALDGPLPLISRQVFDTLVRYVEAGSDVEPGLAVGWSVSKDGLVWTFRLRDGVRFHDGTPLTAQHVVDSLERLMKPGHPRAPVLNAAAPRLLRGTPGVIKEIHAADSRTVRIALVLPYAPLLNVLAHPAFSIVLPSSAGGSGAPFQGTGPFAISEASAGRIALEGRPNHWAGGPRLGQIVFSAVTDDAQVSAALDAQSLNLYIPAGAPPRQNGAVSVPGWCIGYLALQTEKEPFSRPKARRAVAAALDPVAISRAIGASALPLASFVPGGVWSRRDARISLEGDPEAARRLLAESGARKGTAATLLVVNTGAGIDMERVAEAVRTSLAAADLTVTVRTEPADAAWPLARAGEAALALFEACAEAGDPHFLLYPLSSSEGAAKGPETSNVSFYRNARLDDVLIRASQLSFRPERHRLYTRAQAILAEDVPWLPVYVRVHWAVARPEVRNLRLHPSGYHRMDRVSIDAAAGGG